MRLLIFLVFFSCSGSTFVNDVYDPGVFADAPPILLNSIISCKSQCAYTLMSSKLVKCEKIAETCTKSCLHEARSDVGGFLTRYEKPIPREKFLNSIPNK